MGSASGHPSLHDALLEALSDLGCPAYTEELACYLRSSDAYSSLSRSRIEGLLISRLKKSEAGKPIPAQPSLCPALTAERGEPIMRLVARTDWHLELRIVAATTGRLRHLLVTARFCELALERWDKSAAPSLLAKTAATLARALPGVSVEYGRYELRAWRDLARKLIGELSDEDGKLRAHAAAKLSTAPHFDKLYGVSEKYLEGSAA